MDEDGLIAGYVFDGRGGGERCDWHRLAGWEPAQGRLWVHLNRETGHAQTWLREESGLDPVVVDALLDETTRPRCVPMDTGVMLFLRGVNLNPGADPEDMVSIRLWVENDRVISTRMRRLLSVNDLCEALEAGRGPVDVGDFIAMLADRLTSRMGSVVADVDDQVDQLQEQVLETERGQLRIELTRLRREIIVLRRYLAPQRDALARLTQLKLEWLGTDDMLRVREEADRVTRYVEDLDAARERAAVTQEELNNRLSEQLNSRMYVLSIVAAVFLPLGFLTGLLGINVGGIPFAENPWGFLAVVVALLGVVALELLVFRWRRWF
jgi:zinc transporter